MGRRIFTIVSLIAIGFAAIAIPAVIEAAENNPPEISVIAPEKYVLGRGPGKIVVKIFDPDPKDSVVRFKIIPSQGLTETRKFSPGNEVTVTYSFTPKMNAPHKFKVFAWDKKGELAKEEFTIEVERPEGGSAASSSGGSASASAGPSLDALQAAARPSEDGGGSGDNIAVPSENNGGDGGSGGGSFRESLTKRLGDIKIPEKKTVAKLPNGEATTSSSSSSLPSSDSGSDSGGSSVASVPDPAENTPPDVTVQAPSKVIFGAAAQRVVVQAFDRNSKDQIVDIRIVPETGMKVSRSFKPGNPASVEYTYSPPRQISIAFKVLVRDSRGGIGEQEFTIEAEGAPPPQKAPNNAPSITVQKPGTLQQGGRPATITITAYDPDPNDSVMQLNVSPVTGLSGGSSRKQGSRIIQSYTFYPQNPGTYNYVVFARDKNGETTKESFSISVEQKPNDPPQLVSKDSYDVTLSKQLICVNPNNVSQEVPCGGYIRYFSCKPVARQIAIQVQALDDNADTISVQMACPAGSRGSGINTRGRGRVVANAMCEFRNAGSYQSTVRATDNRGKSSTQNISVNVTLGYYTQAVTGNAPSSCIRNP